MKQLVAVSLIAFYLCAFGSSNKSFGGEISDSQCGFNVHSLRRAILSVQLLAGVCERKSGLLHQ
jgi:hypothetical protein